jgi:hypothetical protein
VPVKVAVSKIVFGLLIFQLIASTFYSSQADASTDPILGSAGNFQIVSGAATSIGGAVTGLDAGNISSTTTPVSDVGAAIAMLSTKSATVIPADLGGKTYQPGVYAAVGGAAFAMTSSIILDGKNDCNSQFIFFTPAAMNTTAGISITLINEAKPNNVYWVAGAATTIGASNTLAGNFLSSAAVTVGASSTIDGRFLAIAAITVGASVTFQGFPVAGCSVPVGSLSISVPENMPPKTLTAGETVNIELGQVVVTDTRGVSGAFWITSAQSKMMSDGLGNTFGAENFSYGIRNLINTGGLTLVVNSLSSMQNLSTVLSATNGAAVNSASWTPVISVFVPVDQVAGTYSGSIVHSVA